MKEYIDNLKIVDIPWSRLVTAYCTAEKYPEYLATLGRMDNIDEMNEALDNICDFEHQSTFFAPAPFALIFLKRVLGKARNTHTEQTEWLVKEIEKSFSYYLEVCNDSLEEEWFEGVQPLNKISDLLNAEYLLPENYTEEDIEKYYENFISDDCFYSLYYYSKKILSDEIE